MSERKNIFSRIKESFVKPKTNSTLSAAELAILSKDNLNHLVDEFRKSQDTDRAYVLPGGYTLILERWPLYKDICGGCYLMDQEGHKIDLDLVAPKDFGSIEKIKKADFEGLGELDPRHRPGLVENTLNAAVDAQEIKHLLLPGGGRLKFTPVTLEFDDLTYRTAKISLIDKEGNPETILFEEKLSPEKEIITVGNVQKVQSFFDFYHDKQLKANHDLYLYISSKSDNKPEIQKDRQHKEETVI